MTLKAIREMFKPGEKWGAVNTYMPKADGDRTVKALHSANMEWTWPDGRTGWMDFPKASQVVEAKDGYLSFRLFDEKQIAGGPASRQDVMRNATVSLTRIA